MVRSMHQYQYHSHVLMNDSELRSKLTGPGNRSRFAPWKVPNPSHSPQNFRSGIFSYPFKSIRRRFVHSTLCPLFKTANNAPVASFSWLLSSNFKLGNNVRRITCAGTTKLQKGSLNLAGNSFPSTIGFAPTRWKAERLEQVVVVFDRFRVSLRSLI